MPVVKTYTFPELRTFVSSEQRLVGFQLQEILTNDTGLALGFWKQGFVWLVIDLAKHAPMVISFERAAPFVKGKPKPVSLFMSSHAHDKIVRSVSLDEAKGRVITLHLSDRTEECDIEIHLVPKHPNVFVRAGGKQISWEKPKDLPPLPAPTAEGVSRSLDEIREEWLAARLGDQKPALDPEEQWRKKRDRDLEKKRKALDEIEKQLAEDQSAKWYALGDRLKSGAEEWIDAKQSRSWNIEKAYAKAKQVAAKKAGTEERVRILQAEIAVLEVETFETKPEPRKNSGAELMHKAAVKGRTLVLDDGAMAFIGKSAADNLALLRKARAWDYWMHLRDQPGAHVIIRRERNQNMSDEDLRKVARWLAKESSASKKGMPGVFVVVMTECRYVRPIKGDRLGRVNYHHGREFSVSP